MSDVTIPSDSAASIAYELRRWAAAGGVTAAPEDLRRWADMLDPPPPSLRDEVADLVRNRRLAALTMSDQVISDDGHTDVVLAVVRRHVEALPWTKVSDRGAAVLLRDEVLQLLGAGDE